MIRDLEAVLAVGQEWPPKTETARLERYTQNEALFDGRHAEVFKVLLNLFSTHTAEYNKLIVITNWHRRLSSLWADFLYGEQPTATAADTPDAAEQVYCDDIVARTGFWRLQWTRQIDVSRFGLGVVEAYFENGGAKLQVVHPSKYFPIYDSFGRVESVMIAWLEDIGYVDHVKARTLHVRIHRPGQIETRQYRVSGTGKILEMTEKPIVEETGVDELLVSVVENMATSSGTTVDDYGDLDSIIKRIESRLTRVGRILDVHSEPMLYVGEDTGAFIKTETGEWVYDSKQKVFSLPADAIPPGYVTWDGQLSAAFEEIKALIDQLYIISETCEACFNPAALGAQISGTALRLMLFVPLKKVDRLKLAADPAIRRELQTFAALETAKGRAGAIPLEYVHISWQDGLPEDFKEVVQNITMLKAQGLIWDRKALELLYHLSGPALDEAREALQAERAMEPPLTF